ncbi:hypothetical protein BLNAU_15279 [Blattamonas nauphoetae]|uniref:Uncharacterized protein n=1 Tax=Blattamonas nauphoetae TaxID=2049346 RepID=A0ABQ9XGN9_9EUKA|nr:hypothetical protein BLNAU_15279 [Blattamonas nauphoetae]
MPANDTTPPTDYSDYLDNPGYYATVKSLASKLTGDETVTLTLTLNKTVSGTITVILSNLAGKREEVSGKAPKIERLLLFSFSSSTVGTCSSSAGESGILQFPLSNYKLVAASIPDHTMTAPSSVAIPATPILLDAYCELDASGTEVDLSFSGNDIPKGLCTLTLNNGNTLDVSFSDDSYGMSAGSVQKGVSGKNGDLSEKTDYSLTRIVSKVSPSSSIRIVSGLGFSIPEAARLSKVSVSEFVDERKTTVKLSFKSVKLEKNKKYLLKLKQTGSSEDMITREMWTDGNGNLMEREEILYPLKTDSEERKEQLQFGQSYSVISLTASGRSRSVLISDIVITIPDEPARIERCVSCVLSDDWKKMFVELEGRSLENNIGRVCLTGNREKWESIGAVRGLSTTLSVAEFRVREEEDEDGVGLRKEYTLIEMEDGSSGCLVKEGIQIKVPRPTVLCRAGGSVEAEKCGQSSNPCSSLLVGWIAGQTDEASPAKIVELEVDGEVEMGGVLFVEEKKMRVWGGEKERRRVLVKWTESWESMNAIEVDGGQVWIVEAMLVLGAGREGGMEERKGFLICGGGEVCVKRVVVTSEGEGRVGMGLVGLRWGSADLMSIEMEAIEFGDGVRFAEVGSSKKVVSLSVSSLKTRKVRTLNAPLIAFWSQKEESEVKMDSIVLLETTREESVKWTGFEEGGVVSVRTNQPETSFVRSVFEGSKTTRLSDGADLGGVLFVGVSRVGGGDVRFEECLMIDITPFGSEGGGVVVVASLGVFRVWFENCWMEETRVTKIPFRRLDGIPVLSSERVVVSGVGGVGALIVGEKSLPIVGRSSSRFSGCSLKVVVGRVGGMGGQMNEETKMEL